MLKPLENYDRAQEREYECHSCGRFEKSDNLEDRTVFDDRSYEHLDILICKRCIALGWDKWGR